MRFILLWTWLLWSPGFCDAEQRVDQVRVEGVRRFSPESVASWMVMRPGMVAREQTIASDARRVVDEYEEEGYWHTQVTVEGPDDTGVVRVRVEEGPPTRVDTVILRGAWVVSDVVLRSNLTVGKGSILVPSSLEEDIQGLLTLYERTGYPYASIRPEVALAVDPPAEGDPGASVTLTLDSGPRVTIDGIRFSGLNGTKEEVLLRATGLKVGRPYDRRAIEGATRALRGLPYLADVADVELEQDVRTGRYWLNFDVEETPSTRIEGVFGVLPGSSEGHRVTGLVNAEALNLLGTGRQVSLFWQRPEPLSSDLRFDYREPYLANLPLDASFAIRMAERAGYAESRLEAGLGYHPAPGVSVWVTGGRAAVRPDSLGLGVIDDRSAWVTSFKASLDRVDRLWNARKGYRVDAEIGRDQWNATGLNASTDRVRLRFDVERLHLIGQRSVLVGSVHGRRVWQQGGVTADAWWRLGGAQSIRGYVDEQFLADAAGWARFEWRRLLGPRARAFAFTDSGLLRGRNGGWFSLLGYGGGIQSAVRSGDLRIEYALSRDDAPSCGKVHLRLVSTF